MAKWNEITWGMEGLLMVCVAAMSRKQVRRVAGGAGGGGARRQEGNDMPSLEMAYRLQKTPSSPRPKGEAREG